MWEKFLTELECRAPFIKPAFFYLLRSFGTSGIITRYLREGRLPRLLEKKVICKWAIGR